MISDCPMNDNPTLFINHYVEILPNDLPEAPTGIPLWCDHEESGAKICTNDRSRG